MVDFNAIRVPRLIVAPRFPPEWPEGLVLAFEELFTAANGGIEGEDFIFDMVTGLDDTTKGGLLVAQTDANGQLSVSDLSDAGLLDLINNLVPAADDFIFFSDSTTAALSTVTAFARTLLDDTSATEMRATLELKALAILDGLEVEDEGASAVSDVTTFNFVGPNVIVSDVAGVATVTITQITDEEVEDIVGALVANTTTITFTYDDGTPALTADVNTDSITFTQIQNAIANSKLVGSGAAGVGIDYVEITLGTNLSMSGTTLNATGGITGVDVEDEGSAVVTSDTMNFVGAGVVATDVAGVATITISGGGSGIAVDDEGSNVVAAATTINFVGAGVVATDDGGEAKITIAGAAGSSEVLNVRDEKTADVDGGSCAAGTIQTRTLNTVATNTITGASLSSNQVTLPAGTYLIWAYGPAHDMNRSRCRWFNVTDSTTTILGTPIFAATGDATMLNAHLMGQFIIAGEKDFELRQYTQAAKATIGFGIGVDDGDTEVYSEVLIQKV